MVKRLTDVEYIDGLRESARMSHKTADEMMTMADKRELTTLGHECGHQFTITFTSIMHSSIVGEGPESHQDSEWASEPASVTVRANDLSTALHKAAALPLSAWFPEEGDDDG